MKKILTLIKYITFIITIFLSASTIIHHIMLRVENKNIMPNGIMVNINEHSMHVYIEGTSNDKPTLVFMSGAGTVAPVYDFKPLYSKLSDEYCITVIEKAGYGYSENFSISRDIDTMLEEARQALLLAKIKPPYVLLPHSMSGIEAIYWSQKYPDEIQAIIGLDMAVPEHYENFDFSNVNLRFKIGQISTFLGLHRSLSFIYPLNTDVLTDGEIQQQRYLMYKNAVNKMFFNEANAVYDNAITVKNGGYAECKMLFFVSNGIGIGDYWLPSSQNYAEMTNNEIVYLECSHYIHYYESDFISNEIKDFLN